MPSQHCVGLAGTEALAMAQLSPLLSTSKLSSLLGLQWLLSASCLC